MQQKLQKHTLGCYQKVVGTAGLLPAGRLISPSRTPGEQVALQLLPDFEEADNLKSGSVGREGQGVSKTMLIVELIASSSPGL